MIQIFFKEKNMINLMMDIVINHDRVNRVKLIFFLHHNYMVNMVSFEKKK